MSDNEINSSASALPTNSITSNTGSESVKDLIKEVRAALINYFQAFGNLTQNGYRLTQAIGSLDPQMISGSNHPVLQMLPMWSEFSKASCRTLQTMESYMLMELNNLLAIMYNELDTQKRENCLKYTVTDLLYQTNNAFFQFCAAAAHSFSEFLTERYQADSVESSVVSSTNRGRSNTPSPSNMDSKTTPSVTTVTTAIPQPISPTFRLLENVHRGSEPFPTYSNQEIESLQVQSEHKRIQQPRQPYNRQLPQSQNYQTYQPDQRLENIRGPSPVHGYFELQGPLPNPGQLAKVPFISTGGRPFPFFQINVQRRWSECTGQVDQENNCDNQIRRWSMPTQSRFIPMMTRQQIQQQQSQQHHGAAGTQHQLHQSQDYSQSTTPDSTWHSSVTSQDGLLDAIHLLSIKPASAPRRQSTIDSAGPSTAQGMRPSSMYYVPAPTLTTTATAMPIIYSQQVLQGTAHHVDSIEVTTASEEDRQHSPQPNIYAPAGHYQIPISSGSATHYTHSYGSWWAPNPINDQIVENAGGEEEEKH